VGQEVSPSSISAARRRRLNEQRRWKFRATTPNPAIPVDRQAALVGYFDDNGWGQIWGQKPDLWLPQAKDQRHVPIAQSVSGL
jgi:hypothetical protein